MNESKLKQRLIEVVGRSFGDNLERAEMSFRGLTAEQMNQEYGESGRTRQQIVDEYRRHRVDDTDLLDYVIRITK